ncbi:MAG: LPXTG cell wall anchor domain-containing protein [Microbacterium sp.]|uniref:LPXTG cell wall anchor domain-containing protein n=1 Tax=Microbacterium sp. TaxID=51671 RepID=UPI0039E4B272
MTPEQCVARVDELAATGADAGVWALVAIAGLALAAVGGALVWRRPRRLPLTLAGALVLVAAVAAQLPAGAAHAAGSVSYSDGCTLISVEDVAVSPATTLAPGDETTSIAATVRSVADGPITISLDGSAGSALAGIATAVTAIDGETGVVELAAGATVTVTLTLALPAETGDAAQGLTAVPELTITATQR